MARLRRLLSTFCPQIFGAFQVAGETFTAQYFTYQQEAQGLYAELLSYFFVYFKCCSDFLLYFYKC